MNLEHYLQIMVGIGVLGCLSRIVILCGRNGERRHVSITASEDVLILLWRAFLCFWAWMLIQGYW